jgi:malate dehydrogenase (oxaloacetate-decarboxylating)
MHVVGKEISKIRVVMDNIGHRATLLARLLKEAGVTQLIPVPTHKDHDTPEERAGFERYSGWKIPGTNLEEALNGADLFVSMRPQRLGLAADLSNMADKSIIFFLGDPDRGGDPSDVVNAGCIVAANRTDTPNQIDSILGSMGSLLGALDVYATEINLTMMIAAARSLADVIDRQDLTVDYILPSVFNRDVVKVVARSVAAAALKTQVGRRRWQKPTL